MTELSPGIHRVLRSNGKHYQLKLFLASALTGELKMSAEFKSLKWHCLGSLRGWSVLQPFGGNAINWHPRWLLLELKRAEDTLSMFGTTRRLATATTQTMEAPQLEACAPGALPPTELTGTRNLFMCCIRRNSRNRESKWCECPHGAV